ncbi:MAG: shikimate dehydrogenase [Oscillospiraceae bacterium]|nr:shikimate dehydrogenase [Oscillospiraceae bacterium]
MEYGLIGEHLPHSFSPEIHKRIGDYKYELKELRPEEVGEFLKKRDFKGINVTIPYKQTVIPYLDEIDEAAKAIGAVNTIVNRGGKLYGYNTDFGGMKALIERSGISVFGKKAIILGNGGTSHTAEAVLKTLGAQTVLKTDLVSTGDIITNEEAVLGHSDAEIIINTTPMGMYPRLSGMAVDPSAFPNLKGLVDAVFNPLKTDLVQKAESLGIPCGGGLYMLVMQAILAAEHFFGEPIPKEKAENIYLELLRMKKNIVLIGMPACGKTTIGKLLSDELQRSLFDSDELIIEKAGKEISDIFAEEGEPAFRKLESEAIAELSGKTGAIIATGGGAILNPENIRYLSKNGKIYFLDRPVESLVPTEDRPTASSAEAIKKRYDERYPLYKKYADKIIDADCGIDEVLRKVKEDFLNENFSD